MSAQDNKYGLEHLVGKTTVPRVTNPTIRGSIRRNNPDGGHTAPYFTGLNGTSLTVNVTPVGNLVLTFASDELDDAVTAINAVSPANLQASDDDGYLRLTNLNGGNKNSLTIVSGAAAPILGFVLTPEAGSFSSAGEVATAPPGRGVNTSQSNPQGTALVGADENLTSSSLNRAALGVISHIERIGRELDLEIPSVEEFNVSVSTHAGSGKKVFYVNNPNLRIPLNGYLIISADPVFNKFDQIARLLTIDLQQVIDINQNPPIASVLAAYNNDGTNVNADITQSFTTYGVYDGKSILGDVETIPKHVATAISAIRGDVIVANGATFQSRFVQPGDVVLISGATNNTPFNHNGEFIVTEVLDQTRLAVRAKTQHDSSIITSDRPTTLNPNLSVGSSYGTITVLVGNFYTAGFTVMFEVPAWVPVGSYTARILSGKRLRNLPAGSLARFFEPNPNAMVDVLRKHIALDSVGFRHVAIDVDAPAVAGSPNALTSGTVGSQLAELLNHLNTLIAGEVAYGGGINWADGTPNPATNLEAQVDKILNDLAAPGVDGVSKIRGLALNYMAAGTLRDQIIQLENEWFKLDRNNTITGPNNWNSDQASNNATWSYGASNPNTKASLAFPVDVAASQYKLLMSFGTTGAKTRVYQNTAAEVVFTVNAVWNSTTSLWTTDDSGAQAYRFRIASGKTIADSRVAGAGTWNDASWTILGGFSADIGLALLMTFVGRLTLGGALTSSAADANLARLTPSVADRLVSPRTLIFEFGALTNNGMKVRFFAGDDDGAGTSNALEITVNAFWNSATSLWDRDKAGNSISIRISADGIQLKHRTAGGTWADSAWSKTHYILCMDNLLIANNSLAGGNAPYLDFGLGILRFHGSSSTDTNPTPTDFIVNELRAKGMCKGWVTIDLVQQPSPCVIIDGYNVTSVAYSGNDVIVTIAANMLDTKYCVLVSSVNNGSNGENATISVTGQTTGSFTLAGYNSGSDTHVNLGGFEMGSKVIHVAWFGAQSVSS